MCLLHDEMKVKSDLVYDRRSEQVKGFTNPETWTFDEVYKLISLKVFKHNVNKNMIACINFPLFISPLDLIFTLTA